MDGKLILLLISIHLIFGKTIDTNTLSNYEDIILTNLTGIFTPDFENQIIKGDLNYIFKALKSGSEIILDVKSLNIKSITKNEESIPIQYGEQNPLYGPPLYYTL